MESFESQKLIVDNQPRNLEVKPTPSDPGFGVLPLLLLSGGIEYGVC